MSEHAKRLAKALCLAELLSEQETEALIDAEFAEVIEDRNTLAVANITMAKRIGGVRRERDDLKKALGELVENSKKAVSRCTHSEMATTYARNLRAALAAAEKLPEEDDGTQSQ